MDIADFLLLYSQIVAPRSDETCGRASTDSFRREPTPNIMRDLPSEQHHHNENEKWVTNKISQKHKK